MGAIDDVVPTGRNSLQDSRGIDMVVIFASGNKPPLQIKTKNRKSEAKRSKYEERGICFITISSKWNREEIAEIVFQSICLFMKSRWHAGQGLNNMLE